MLPQHDKKYKVTIEFEVSGAVAGLVTEEHIAGNIESDLQEEDRTFLEATDEIELWGEYYGDYEDVWYLYRHSQESKVKVVEIDQFEYEKEEEERLIEGMDKLVNGPKEFPQKPSYTIYRNGDDEVFEGPKGTELNRFTFMGFGDGIHPYFQKQLEWLDEMLFSVGIFLNRKTYRTVDEIGDAPNGWWDDPDKINLPNEMKVSSDGKIYFHAQDSEMGRGGAVLMVMDVERKIKTILDSDHRDSIRERLCYEFAIEKGVDLEIVDVKDVEKYL
jgi:hypothetical protein